VLVGRGASGLSTAVAIATFYPEMKVLYIRKDEDNSHGRKHEAILDVRESITRRQNTCIIVDDFVSGGYTVATIIQEMYETYGVGCDGIALLGCYEPTYVKKILPSEHHDKLPSVWFKSSAVDEHDMSDKEFYGIKIETEWNT
jgi:adenine/guanine phosphoribosyltransferase-like PRPP-binding protein